MNNYQEMAAAAAETVRVVRGVRDDQLKDPSPCHDWDVRTLLNHIILWTAYSAEQRAYGKSVAEELMNKDFAAEPDFADDYAAQVDRALTAWSDPQTWERELGVMGNAMPAADVAAMLIMEIVLHGWDLAKATGQEYHCPDNVAALVLRTVQEQGDMFRQYKGFADPIDVPADAPVFDRVLGLSGRDPAS
ncbi:MAG TPA: TIGR03086 family metal-binding protein [Streptosporangiaceae bacterium]